MKERILSLLLIVTFMLTFNICKSQKKDIEIWKDTSQTIDKRVDDLISKLTIEEKISQLVHTSHAISRMNIPEYDWWNECLHGVARNGKATVFPQAIGLAATFDEELAGRIASAISDEARAKFNIAIQNGNRGQFAGLTFWTPNINIFRDPRWGRGQETYGEDPFLTSHMAGAIVKGLQGDNPKYLKVVACAKHFAVHSGPEAERHVFNAQPSKKDLYDTYLPAFQYLVEKSKVAGVMCAYNRLYGSPCCGSTFLLKDLLRKNWHFEGYIVSDCWAVNDFHENHKVTSSHAESAALSIKNGVNVICGDSYPALVEAAQKGLLTKNDVDEAVRKLYNIRFRLGLMDATDANPYNKISPDVINCSKHQELAREAAGKSIVLLMNKNNILPLKKDIKKLYIVGPNATNGDVLLGNYYGQSGNLVTILAGITSHVSAGTTVEYKHGVLLDRPNVNPIDWTTSEAHQSDAIVAVMGISGLLEGEEGDAIASPTKGDRLDINLPENQIAYLKKLRSTGNKPIILILTGGSPMIIPEIEKLADVVLWVGYPGEQGGNAVADVIFGDMNPAGRLPITFPASLNQIPAFDDYSMIGRTYRYMKLDPMFPFGFGLSYSKFQYSNLKLNSKKIKTDSHLDAEVEVKNISNTDGEEVVQLYITSPVLSKDDPLYSLKGFQRVKIKAGESKIIHFDIQPEMLSLSDDEGIVSIRKGTYTIFIGGSSPCKRSQELGISQPISANFEVGK